MKIRQDAWTEENDFLLAETVLRHVREGSTQLNAFEEVGDKLNRTSAACGFRWNAVVRQRYEKALDLAKKQRKQRKRLLGKDQGGKKKLLYQPPMPSLEEIQAPILPSELNSNAEESVNHKQVTNHIEETVSTLPQTLSGAFEEEMNLGKVVAYLQQLHHSEFSSEILSNENERLKREIADLQAENKELQKKVDELEDHSVTMQEDYETLMKILNRARKLVLFDEEERPSTSFKMDRNGNLEKMAE